MSASQKQWADMSSAEKDAYQTARRDKAKALIATGDFPKALKAETIAAALVGQILRPTGGTDKGSVSYGLKGVTFSLNTPHGIESFRLNTMNVSKLGVNTGKVETAESFSEDDYIL